MSWYTLVLFAHIVGVLTLFISLAVQWLSTLRVRHAGSMHGTEVALLLLGLPVPVLEPSVLAPTLQETRTSAIASTRATPTSCGVTPPCVYSM